MNIRRPTNFIGAGPTEPFPLQRLKYQEFVFTAAEVNRLQKYGAWAEALESGTIEPQGEKQIAFVAACNGKREPETDFELLWLRYRSTCKADKTIAHLVEEVAKARSEADSAKSELERLRKSFIERIDRSSSEVKSQKSLLTELTEKVARYEAKLGIESLRPMPSAPRTSREICPNCGGDGGATGQCYKCDGTGWIVVNS